MRQLAFALLLVMMGTTAAQAETFVWQDAKTGVTLSFPDTWRIINNQKTDDLVTIIGPSQQDTPMCRLRARQDQRYTVYPVWYSAPVQHVAYNEDFWTDYLNDYDYPTVHSYRDDAALGRAFASMTMASFAMPNDTAKPRTMRTGQMWAGVYYNTAYVLDCSSTAASFADWQPDFLSIAKSVDTRKIIHELLIGDYRNFINDGHLTHPIKGRKDKLGQTYN